MKCQVCSQKSRVLDTRKHTDGVWRQRICPSDHRFWTLEVPMERRPGLFYDKEAYKRLKERKYEW